MTIRGIAFPFGKSTSSLPAAAEDFDVIDDNIKRILQTRRGARVMRPSVGSDVYDFVFESIGAVLRARIDDEVRESIAANEPRAQVLRVDVKEITSTLGAHTVVDVSYRVNSEVRSTSVTIPRG